MARIPQHAEPLLLHPEVLCTKAAGLDARRNRPIVDTVVFVLGVEPCDRSSRRCNNIDFASVSTRISGCASLSVTIDRNRTGSCELPNIGGFAAIQDRKSVV